MTKFFEALGNMFRVPDLRKRVLFTLMILAIYRIGGYIPTPGINTQRFSAFFTQNAAGGFLGYFDLFSGGMLRHMTIFALGIMPYITASIILQLLQVVIPTLDKLQKEGELGRRKITQWTRYLTIVLAVLQSIGIAFALQDSSGNFVINPGWSFVGMTVLTLTASSTFIMWLGEQITDRGIGNGMSLIIFVGIIVGLPNAAVSIYQNTFVTHQWPVPQMIAILVVMLAVVA
ncbi:MAG TPA: preprotein translocase subunit SecY, partial [Bryobacteraceae bacterium]